MPDQHQASPELPPLPEPIGQIVGGYETPPGTTEFWGYFSEGHVGKEKVSVYTADDLRSYALAYAEVVRERTERQGDEAIDLAVALEQHRALEIVDAVHNLPIGGREAIAPTAYQAGHCHACEEIEHRLRTEKWELNGVPAPLPPPPGEAAKPLRLLTDAERLDAMRSYLYGEAPIPGEMTTIESIQRAVLLKNFPNATIEGEKE